MIKADMGREPELALRSVLRRILIHLLKFQYSPAEGPRDRVG